ncbi:MAG: type II toxin-antitoxin system VapC family toxin [Spirochaetales bacterium]|nr:type II toxin-antitoxin system VapC family toxin [Spirochaetales bacterium]
MTHLLDTNICIYLIKKQPESVVRQMQSKEIEQVGISTITLSELEYGVAKSQYTERNRVALLEFLTPFRILDFDQAAAHEYGHIRTFLEEKGQLIGPMDLLIAAHAIARNLVLVTNNEREFRRVPALKIENWAAE